MAIPHPSIRSGSASRSRWRRIPVLAILGILACAGLAGAAQTELFLAYYGTAGSGADETMQAIVDLFEAEHPDTTVATHVAPYSQFFQELPIRLAAGTAPDVWLSDGVLVSQYVDLGAALDLTPWIERDLDEGDYLALDTHRDLDGRVWAFPQGLQATAFFYNRQMFEEAGVAFPSADWTLERVRESAGRLSRDTNGDGDVEQYGFRSANHITEGWYAIIRSFGGRVLDPTWRRSEFDHPRTIAALRYLVDMIYEDQSAVPPAKFGTNVFDWFPNRHVAMQYAIHYRTITANQAELDYDVSLVPLGPAGRAAPAIVNAWVIHRGARQAQQTAAWEWIKFFASEEPQRMWTLLGEAVPVNRSVATSTFLDLSSRPANRRAFVEGLAYAVDLDPNPVWSDWVGVAHSTLAGAFAGQVSVEEAALEADRRIQQILDEYYQGR